MYNLTPEHLSAYLPYGLKTDKGLLWAICNDGLVKTKLNDGEIVKGKIENLKPLLRPLSQLTQEIEHKGERFVPIEWFEIGDDENTSMEYDHGNIKLVKTLDSIAKYNIHNDINYLPYGVAQKLIKWHFDVFGLIEKKLAIDINTLK